MSISARPAGLENDRGAQAVEFGLIFTFALVPLILGLIQMGAMFYSQITITQAAREAVRQVALNVNSGTSGQCDSTCQNDAAGTTGSTASNAASPLTLSSSSVTTCGAGATQSSQATVTLQASTLLPIFFSATVTGSASMPCGG